MRDKKILFRRIFSFIMIALLIFGGFPGISNVNATVTNPDFTINRSINKTTFNEGESGTFTYTVTPSGTASNSTTVSADIVLVFDISPSMKASKLNKATIAAGRFLDMLQGSNAKVSLVTFGYKVDYKTALTTNYTQIKGYIWDLQNKDLFEGTNYHDALTTANEILKSGTSKNKYVLFLTDGMPNYFVSSSPVKNYAKNSNSHLENGKYYLTNWPSNTPEAYDYAKNVVREMGQNKVTLNNIGLGKKDEVDLDYLKQLSDLTGGVTYPVKEAELEAIYDSLAREVRKARISNMQIIDTLPEGVTLGENSNVVKLDNGKFLINIPDIIYESTTTTPGPVTAKVNVIFNKKGDYVFNQGVINYTSYSGVNASKPINSVSVKVNGITQPPNLDASRQFAQTTAVEGETVRMNFSFNPTGVFTETAASRKPADIVLVIDKSLSMLDKTGQNSNNKLQDAKTAAIQFVNAIKAKGLNDRIALVTFNRHSDIDMTLGVDYTAIINKINAINPNNEASFDQATNYEIGMNTAKKLLETSLGSKYIIFLSDGKPNAYVGNYEYPRNLNDFENVDNTFILYHYLYGNNAYRYLYANYELNKRNLQYGEYAYYGDDVYSEVEETAKNVSKSGITMHAIGLGSAQNLDMNMINDIARLGGGKAYLATNSGELTGIFTDISNNITQQKISNITVTMNLPQNVKALEDTNLTIEGSKVTFRIPDIVFEKDKGTPSASDYVLNLKFNKYGLYNLENDAEISYIDYLGNKITKKLNNASINITMGAYTISHLNADPVKTGEKITSIHLTWDPNEIELLDNVREYIIQRSINGGAYTEIGRVGATTGEFTDNNVSTTGDYVYRIITVVKGQNGAADIQVQGATSNTVKITRSLSNIAAVTSANFINNLRNSNIVVDGFRVKSQFTLVIVDESIGVSSGGIENPSLTFKLNQDNNDLVNCKFAANSKIQLLSNTGTLIYEQVITPVSQTLNQISLNYTETLAPGTYKIEFSFIPERKAGKTLPERGTELKNTMNMTWKDKGITQVKTMDQLYRQDSQFMLDFNINVVRKPILN